MVSSVSLVEKSAVRGSCYVPAVIVLRVCCGKVSIFQVELNVNVGLRFGIEVDDRFVINEARKSNILAAVIEVYPYPAVFSFIFCIYPVIIILHITVFIEPVPVIGDSIYHTVFSSGTAVHIEVFA